MGEQLAQIGIGAIVAIMILREVFSFLNKRRNGKTHNPYCEIWNGVDMAEVAKQVEHLHDQHSKTDEDGVPLWYVRKSLEKTIEHLVDAVNKQTRTLDTLVSKLDRLTDKD